MIKFLLHEEIDKTLWDQRMKTAVNGNLNACAWYLDMVSPGWCALAEDGYAYLFPLPMQTKAGIKYSMQPFFTQQLGLFYQAETGNAKLQEFISSIPDPIRYIDINLNTANHLPEDLSIQRNVNLELNLSAPYEIISGKYHNNLQRNLKKANQANLHLAKNISPTDLVALFRLNKGKDLKHISEKHYALMEQITNASIARGLGEVWGVKNDSGQIIAGALWVNSHRKCIFLFSGLSDEGKTKNAMPWLIDRFIQENAATLLTLDFEGSNNQGLARFYSSFGANRFLYPRFKRNTLPPHQRIALYLWRLARKKIKK